LTVPIMNEWDEGALARRVMTPVADLGLVPSRYFSIAGQHHTLHQPTGRRLERLMAQAMLWGAAGHEACSEADLQAAGFTLAEIKRHGDAARAQLAAAPPPRRAPDTPSPAVAAVPYAAFDWE
jgi:hypothetical protein